MTVIGIIGAGEVGSQIARAAVGSGYQVAVANSRGPHTLSALVAELGPAARAATASQAARFGDFVVIAVPLKLVNDMPVDELAGKVVLDTNNYMPWRDGIFPDVASGRRTVHELRQDHLPTSKVVKAFTHIQAPTLLRFARAEGDAGRLALAVSSDHPEAVEVATTLQGRIGYDTVDNSPLSESWRTAPGTPGWRRSLEGGQGRNELVRNLAAATRPRPML